MPKKTKEQMDAETRERLKRNAERLRSAAAASNSGDVNAYISARLAEARAAALEKSRTRTMPAVPVGGADDSKKKAAALRNDASLVRSRLSWPAYGQGVYHPLDFNYSVNGAIGLRHVDPERLRIAALRRASELEKEAELYDAGKKLANGASCIYTATDNYGKQYRVASNRVFEANDVSNGFLRIPMSDVEPGDIVQSKAYGLNGAPGHGMILDSIDGYSGDLGVGRGDPAFNYSNGGEDENAIVRGGHFTDKDSFRDDNWFNAFRFVGTPADSLRWKNEYEQMNQKASGGLINRFDEGGSTGEIRPSKPSNVVQRYLSDHPMTGHRLRKAGVLAADLARVFPGTSFLMDLYDSKHPKTESDGVTNALGAIGRGTDIITNTVREAGEAQPSIRRILRGSPLGKLISLPDLVSDSAQFIRDFSEPVEHFDTGGLLRRFDEGTPGQLYYIPDFAAVDNTTPVNYVTESGPFLQLDADSLYGGEIAPAVMVADDQSRKTVSRAQHNANRRRVLEMMQDDAPLLASPRDVTAVKQQIVAEPQVAVDKSSVESSVMDAMVHQNYGRLKKLNKAENKESIKALQRELLAHGYDLGKSGENKDGVDGVIGSKTLRALRAYRNEKPKVEYGNVEDPLPISNAVYAVASNIPGLKYFVPDSFRGTEDEARNLGYKTYIDPVDGKRKSVNYPVTFDGNDVPTRRDIAAAQMRKYGITGDFTSDKSAYQRNNYAYLPAYGYNFLAPFYNKKENLPVADPFTGTAVRLGANRIETGAERAKDWYNKTFGKNVVYTYADASPAREDYRNLYFGYPQRNGTLMVNENVDRMNSGEFRTGYAFVPRDSNAILALANGIGNGDGVQYTSGHQLGNFGYGRNADNERWYYDDWDLIGDNTKIGFSLIGGKPFQVYDRDFKGGKKK